MKLLSKECLADGVILSGVLVNAVFIGLILYFYII